MNMVARKSLNNFLVISNSTIFATPNNNGAVAQSVVVFQYDGGGLEKQDPDARSAIGIEQK